MAYPIRSMDQQVRDAHEASGQTFLWHLFDVCLGCYLQAHGNGDNELLLGTYVDGESTVNQVLNGLEDEFRQIGYDLAYNKPGYDHDAARDALAKLREDNADRLDRLFDASLEVPDGHPDDTDEWPQAWFLLTWEDDASPT